MSWCIAIVNPFNIAKLAIFLEHRAWRIRRRCCLTLRAATSVFRPLACRMSPMPRSPQVSWPTNTSQVGFDEWRYKEFTEIGKNKTIQNVWLVSVWFIHSLYGVVCCKQLKSSFAVSVSTVSFLAWLMTNVYQWSPAMMPCIERPLDPKPKPFSTVPEMYIQLHFGAILQRVSSRKSYGLGSERAPSGKSICPSQLWKTSSKCPRR